MTRAKAHSQFVSQSLACAIKSRMDKPFLSPPMRFFLLQICIWCLFDVYGCLQVTRNGIRKQKTTHENVFDWSVINRLWVLILSCHITLISSRRCGDGSDSVHRIWLHKPANQMLLWFSPILPAGWYICRYRWSRGHPYNSTRHVRGDGRCSHRSPNAHPQLFMTVRIVEFCCWICSFHIYRFRRRF